MPRQQVEMLDARSEGHKGKHIQVVSVRVRIRNEFRGSRSSARAYGGTVVRMLELVSCFSRISDHGHLFSWVLASMYERWGTVVLFEQLWR